LKTAYDWMMDVFEGLSADDWTNLTVTHGYLGPLPAFFYPVFQIMDYGVHSWDIRQGLERPHYLHADVGDILVPFMFILWQATTDTVKVGSDPLGVGTAFRSQCRNVAGEVTSEGMTYEAGDIDAPCDLGIRPEPRADRLWAYPCRNRLR
jgi:hypothetical protein